jgi:DNA-binding LytR/AlgR family response regulator
MTISCIIIDDEPSSQAVLKNFISNIDFLELKGICNNAIEALEMITASHSIDLIFLDINMPKISGLTFYKSLQNPPEVIFTTAYPEYAISGFEVNAIDYLLKPFSFDRFFIAINKVIEKKSIAINKPNQEHFILIKSNKILYKITSENILFIEAFGDYVKVYLEDKFILTNATFSSVLDSLPKHIFIRSHKSFAINFNKMTSVHGNQISVNNYKIPIGQKYKSDFMKAINHN